VHFGIFNQTPDHSLLASYNNNLPGSHILGFASLLRFVLKLVSNDAH